MILQHIAYTQTVMQENTLDFTSIINCKWENEFWGVRICHMCLYVDHWCNVDSEDNLLHL